VKGLRGAAHERAVAFTQARRLLRPGDNVPPLFIVHGLGGGIVGYADLVHHLLPGYPIYGLKAVGLDSEAEPHATIEAMAAICVEAEKSQTVHLDADFLDQTFSRIDQSIAMGALFTAHHLQVKAIAALTDSGATALWMSRHGINIPIYAMTPNVASQRKMALYRNVQSLPLANSADRDEALHQAEELLVARGVVQRGDFIVLTVGEPMGQAGGTNTLKIVRVGMH
jgi:pyruvate kinase